MGDSSTYFYPASDQFPYFLIRSDNQNWKKKKQHKQPTNKQKDLLISKAYFAKNSNIAYLLLPWMPQHSPHCYAWSTDFFPRNHFKACCSFVFERYAQKSSCGALTYNRHAFNEHCNSYRPDLTGSPSWGTLAGCTCRAPCAVWPQALLQWKQH